MLLSEHVCNDNQRVNWALLGEKLKEMREGAKINRSQMAQRIGVSKSTITRIEDAENRPDVETLEMFVVGCGRRLSQLFHLVEGGQIHTPKDGVNPAVVGAFPDGQSASFPGLTAKACRDLVRIFENASEELAKAERLSAKNRRSGRGKTGGA